MPPINSKKKIDKLNQFIKVSDRKVYYKMFHSLVLKATYNYFDIEDDVKEIVKTRFNSRCDIHYLGSRVIGLGYENESDLDLFIDIGNRYLKTRNYNKDIDVIERLKEIFDDIPQDWTFKKMNYSVPSIKVIHNKSGIKCDISVTNGLAVHNSKLLGHLFELQPECVALFHYLKKWLKVFDVRFKGFSLTLMLIFYIQQIKMMPSIRNVQLGVYPEIYIDIARTITFSALCEYNNLDIISPKESTLNDGSKILDECEDTHNAAEEVAISIDFTQDSTTDYTTETSSKESSSSTTQEITTDQTPIWEDCEINNTSYHISDSYTIAVSWSLNDAEPCNLASLSIYLINQSCEETCESENCSCVEEQNTTADQSNVTFLTNMIPCTKYYYQIQINNSTGSNTNITTNSLKYLKPRKPELVNSTDTTLTFKVFLNNPDSECQDIMYSVECKANEYITENSNSDVLIVKSLEPRQNYTCSARIKHGETDWSENSEPSIFTTNAADCNLTKAEHILNEETNILTINWETNGSEMCDTAFVNITLTNKNCVDKCTTFCSCEQFYDCKANDRSFSFTDSLIPCANYSYQIQIMNSILSTGVFTSTIEAFRKYAKIENLTITDEEEFRDDSKTLNMTIKWDYKNVECMEVFSVIARGQGNNFESTTQTNSYTFSNLQACEEFNINVHIKDNQNINTSAVHTMKKIEPSEIQNLTLTQGDDKMSIIVAWVAPKYGSKCIDRYYILVKNDLELGIVRNTTSEVNLIADVYACVNYSITVSTNNFPSENQSSTTTLNPLTSSTRLTTFPPSISPDIEIFTESSKTGFIKTEPRPFNQPQHLQLEKQTDKSLSFTVIPSNDPKNLCQITQYYVECTSNEVKNKTKSASSSSKVVEVEGLEPFQNYSCKGAIENESKIKSIWGYNKTFMTSEGVPSAPEKDITQGFVNSTSFSIKWKEPKSPKGIIKYYEVTINFVKFTYDNPPYCSQPDVVIRVNTTGLTYTFMNGRPSSIYTYQVRAYNQAFAGEFSNSEEKKTSAGPPDELQNFIIHKNEIRLNETYNRTIFVDFNYPCLANGEINRFTVEFKAGNKSPINKTIFYNNTLNPEVKYNYRIKVDELEPDELYLVNGYAYGEKDTKGKEQIVRDFKLNAGIPEPSPTMKLSSESSSTSIKISIPSDLFDSNVGRISHALIFIQQWNCSDMSHKQGFNDSEKLIWVKAMEYDCIPEYFTGVRIENKLEKHLTEGIGSDELCEEGYCNGRLRPGRTYGLTFRLYTETGYSNTKYFKISTNKEVPIVAISIIIISILCLVFLIGFYISCRRTNELQQSALDSPYDRKDVSVQNFQKYYIEMSDSEHEKIKEEYKAIQYFSETLNRTYIASRANERLNRFVNIYPYDSTRVVLNDDEFENDYINASYINGYYYPKEYIATQGPKPDTVLDFWRMIIQHRVESIVMLTSLVESNKVKCHEYFPRLNGRLKTGNIIVTCIKEQNFVFYIKRVLIVEKNDMKLSVNHYYFCVWPDHGCPSNAIDLIEFVKIVRNERQKSAETFVVHCSAGVGRTGTFIAVDIMMQRIKKEAKINIFDLVKQLRSQRMKMVQTLEQYMFLYTIALELVTNSRRSNVLQNFRDAVIKFVNELELTERFKQRDNSPNEMSNIVKKDEKETVM